MKNLTPIHPENDFDADTRKRLFIGLISGASFFVILVLTLLWLIPFIGLSNIHPTAPYLLGLFFLCLILFIGWAWLSIVLSILLGRHILFSRQARGFTIKLFLPLMTIFARFIGMSKEKVRNSFIKVNNELVRGENCKFPADKILLLMPHCLQNSRCDMRLTYDIMNCKRCGKCPIKNIIELSETYGVHLAIATGGTIARRIVVQTRPKLIIAVACERDLASGIQDTYPIPVYGVLNERPKGPCLDTLVPMEQLEQAIRLFLSDYATQPSHAGSSHT